MPHNLSKDRRLRSSRGPRTGYEARGRHFFQNHEDNRGIITLLPGLENFVLFYGCHNPTVCKPGDYGFQYCHNHFLGSDYDSTEIHNPPVCKLWDYDIHKKEQNFLSQVIML